MKMFYLSVGWQLIFRLGCLNCGFCDGAGEGGVEA